MRLIGLAVVVAVNLILAPLAAEAQQAKVPRVGLLMPGTAQEQTDYLLALRNGLRELGYAEGKTLTIEYRWAEFQTDRWAELVADLVASKVDMILSPVGSSTVAARRATNTIPIIMMANADVVEQGLLDHVVRPQQERLRDRQPERLGGLEIDDQLKLGGLLNRKIGGLSALKDLVHVGGGAST